MLVYGDTARAVTTGEKLHLATDSFRSWPDRRTGIERHALLVSAFIETGELAQGLADAAFRERGSDDDIADVRAVMIVLLSLAAAIGRSWRSGFDTVGNGAAGIAALEKALRLERPITCRVPEGYAHYALYPEAYLMAGATLPPDVLVIGIRSIGTGLAALAATGAGTAIPPLTIRPFGHPFARRLSLSPGFAGRLLSHAGPYAIADEGPGLSGSSFGAVADFLEEGGVEPARIHFLPSHGGDPGPQASDRHRERWRNAQRHVVGFDALALAAPSAAHRLTAWVADLTGAAAAPPEDISAGAWRRHRFAETEWPPAHSGLERRKFLLRGEAATYLLKFAGLGSAGERKLARARALHDAGFVPEPLGLRHGFLVERWIGEARPFSSREFPREALIGRLARYLAFRARHFPAAAEDGASPAGLLEMARVNIRECLGEVCAARAEEWVKRLPDLERRRRPVAIDGRLQSWEWLVRPDGVLLKTDAVDHCMGHDLIGCQDIAWDIAGAATELGLSDEEISDLAARVALGSGQRTDPLLLAFFRLCYAAFQAGLWTFALAACSDGKEIARLGERLEFCRRALKAQLG